MPDRHELASGATAISARCSLCKLNVARWQGRPLFLVRTTTQGWSACMTPAKWTPRRAKPSPTWSADLTCASTPLPTWEPPSSPRPPIKHARPCMLKSPRREEARSCPTANQQVWGCWQACLLACLGAPTDHPWPARIQSSPTSGWWGVVILFAWPANIIVSLNSRLRDTAMLFNMWWVQKHSAAARKCKTSSQQSARTHMP